MKASVLLLGANGQLGSLLKESVPASLALFPFTSSELDISKQEDVAKIIEEVNPDVIINAAAYTKVDEAEEHVDRAFAVNAQGPGYIAEAAAQQTKIVHISTDFVFDGEKDTPYQTNDATGPLGVYGESKLAGEKNLLSAHANTAIIRTAWLYSAQGNNFVNTMLSLMSTRKEISVVSDQKGTPTSAHTLAKVVWRLADKHQATGIYHWTDNGETNWYEFALAVHEQGLRLGLLETAINIKPITTSEYLTAATRPKFSVLDKGHTCKTIGFEGRDWREELERTLLLIRDSNL